VQCSIMYVQCNKAKIRFSRARPLFKKEPNFPYFNDCNGLRPTTKIDSLLRRKPRNRLGLIVKIDADLKRTVWNIKGLGDVFLERLDSMLRRQPLSAITGMLSAIDRNHCPPSNGMPVRHQRNTHWWSGVDLLHKNRN